MATSEKIEVTSLDDEKRYVECKNCAMESICIPISAGNNQFDISDSYLTKRVHTPVSQTLFTKDENISSIYAVCSGTFKLTDTADGGGEKVLGFRFPGELIGEDSLYPEKYGYNAVAIANSAVCKISVNELMACSNVVPDLQLSLVKLLTRQGYTNRHEFQALISKKSADSLLAAFLLNVHERKLKHDGYAFDDDKYMINLNMSRDNIANFLGLRRETLSRILSKFQKEQLIYITGKHVELKQVEFLRRLANQ